MKDPVSKNARAFSAAGALGFALFMLLSRSAPGAPGPQEGQKIPTPSHEVKVTLKLIQVYVADKEGKPVQDLTKADFSLLDNGQAVTITEFEKHFAGPAGAPRPEDIEAVRPEANVPPLLSRKFILLFDARNSSAYGFGMAKKAALEFLDAQVKPEDEIAVLSYKDVAGFRVHEFLTTNHARIRDVVAGLAEIIGPSFIGYIKGIDDGGTEALRDAGAAMAVRAREGERGASADGGRMNAGAGGIAGLSRGEAGSGSDVPFVVESTAVGEEAKSAAVRHPDFPLGLQQIAKALNTIPGYKNILLFSDGYPRYMVLDEKGSFSQILRKTGQDLAAASSRVFAINTQRPLSLMARGDRSLQKITEATGGRYFGKIEDYDDIGRAIQDFTENYYVLGYYITDAWDGRLHELKVAVKRPDCTVSAPASFSNSRPFSEYSDLEKEIHLFDLALGDRSYFQEPVNLPMTVLPCSNGPRTSLLLLSRVSPEDLGDIVKGKAEVFHVVRDSGNRIVDAKRAVVDFAAVTPGPLFQYGLATVGPGRYECRMVLRNLETGLGAVAKKTIEVPKPEDSGLRVDPPLLFLPLDMGKVQYLHVSPPARKKDKKPPLALQDVYPLTANELLPVIDILPATAPSLAFEVRILAADAARIPLKLMAVLVDPDGVETDLPARLLGRTTLEGAVVCLAEGQLPGLRPGSYVLRIGALNTQTNASAWSERAFEVK